MSMGDACKCTRIQGRGLRFWVVTQRQCNHSAFNGYRKTPSAYSGVRCTLCGAFWRTRAAYVARLPDATRDQATYRELYDGRSSVSQHASRFTLNTMEK